MLKKFAADLKKQRENRNITLADIAAKTRIHISLFEKMENGDFSFYGPTYIRAFIRQYAKAAGLNQDEVLYNYELAKSGKYSQRAGEMNEQTPQETASEKKEPADSESSIVTLYGKPGMAENSSSEEYDTAERKKFSSSKRINFVYDRSYKPSDNGRKSFNIPVSFFKNAGIVLLALVLIFAVYMLIRILFLDDKENKVEIVRQDFNEVVQENEKKILGKRTEQEIADSIKKANETADSIKNAMQDSVSLVLVGTKKGKLSVYVDSIAVENLWRENFSEGDSGVYKAKNQFFLTSDNTSSFKAYLNGKPLSINRGKVDRVKITRDGIKNYR